jgi:ribosome modulation factor
MVDGKTTLEKREEEARREGRRAGYQGQALVTCPYVYMTALWVYWHWGWYEGRDGKFFEEANRDYETAQ